MNLFAVKLELIILEEHGFSSTIRGGPVMSKGATKTIGYYMNYWYIDHFNIELWSFDALLTRLVINSIHIISLAYYPCRHTLQLIFSWYAFACYDTILLNLTCILSLVQRYIHTNIVFLTLNLNYHTQPHMLHQILVICYCIDIPSKDARGYYFKHSHPRFS